VFDLLPKPMCHRETPTIFPLSLDVQKQTPQLTETHKAGTFVMAPGARGIAPPNLHTESQSTHLFMTKFI